MFELHKRSQYLVFTAIVGLGLLLSAHSYTQQETLHAFNGSSYYKNPALMTPLEYSRFVRDQIFAGAGLGAGMGLLGAILYTHAYSSSILRQNHMLLAMILGGALGTFRTLYRYVYTPLWLRIKQKKLDTYHQANSGIKDTI